MRLFRVTLQLSVLENIYIPYTLANLGQRHMHHCNVWDYLVLFEEKNTEVIFQVVTITGSYSPARSVNLNLRNSSISMV